MQKLLFIFLLCPLLAFAQKDWKATSEANTITYVPINLPANKKFQLKFYKITLNGVDKKTWIIQHAKDQQSNLGNTTKKWKTRSEKQGEWSTSNEYTTFSGRKLAIGYETGTLKNGNPYVYQFISSIDIGLLIKYGLKIKKLKPYAEKELMRLKVPALAAATTKTPSKPEVPTKVTPASQKDVKTTRKGLVSASEFSKMKGEKRQQYVRRNIRTKPNQGVKLSSIETVLVDIEYNTMRGKVTSYTYLLFKDGTVYGDCTTPIRDLNVNTSKKLEQGSSKWTRWKKQKGKYYFQNTKTKEWVLKKNLERALPGKEGLRLNNTYWTFSGNHFFGTSTSHKGYYKFMPNGRFEISSFTMSGGDMGGIGTYTGTVSKSDKKGSEGTTVVSGGNVGGGVTSKRNDGSKNTGTYYIDGYTIEFHHDNGWVHRELFHFPEEHGRKYIHIGDEVYWIKDKD